MQNKKQQNEISDHDAGRRLIYAHIKGEATGIFVCSTCQLDFAGDALDALRAFDSHKCRRITFNAAGPIRVTFFEKATTAVGVQRIVELLKYLTQRWRRKHRRSSFAGL